jgi:hypothetical protein
MIILIQMVNSSPILFILPGIKKLSGGEVGISVGTKNLSGGEVGI